MRRSTILFLCFATLQVGTLRSAEPLPIHAPETVGLSSTRLQRVDELVRRQIAEKKIVAAVTMVARNGKVTHRSAIGHADVDAKKPIKNDAIFRIYSMTKPITTTAAMMLYEQGKFQLDDPLHWYLSEFKSVRVHSTDNPDGDAPKRPISVRDLMRHTSGLTYGIFGNTEVDQQYRSANVLDRNIPLSGMVEKLSKLPLQFSPGERFEYSVSTDVLARLVEVLSGKRFDRFLMEHILKPLGMHDTDFYVPQSKIARLPFNYRWNRAGKRSVADDPSTSVFRNPPTFYSGGGGLVSTIDDYMKFCLTLSNHGNYNGVQLLSAKTVKLMTMNHLQDAKQPATGVAPGAGAGFGLGFRVTTDVVPQGNLVSTGTYGWGGMASTMFFIDPQEKLIGIIMTQKLPTDTRLRNEFQTAVYQSITDSYGD